jgi:hypothetical protein
VEFNPQEQLENLYATRRRLIGGASGHVGLEPCEAEGEAMGNGGSVSYSSLPNPLLRALPSDTGKGRAFSGRWTLDATGEGRASSGCRTLDAQSR